MTPTLPTPRATNRRPGEEFDPRRSGCAPTTTTTTTAPPVPATAAPPLAPQQPVPQQQAAPPPPQAPSCGYAGSISVSGGNVGSLPPSDGNSTATGPSSISISGLPVCGQHYRLEWRADHPGGGFHRGSDCKLDGFSTQIPSQSGSAVSVQILLPPNACG